MDRRRFAESYFVPLQQLQLCAIHRDMIVSPFHPVVLHESPLLRSSPLGAQPGVVKRGMFKGAANSVRNRLAIPPGVLEIADAAIEIAP